MSQSQFDALQRQITLLHLEWVETMKKMDEKINLMHASLKSCQSHCHVANQNQENAT